jgi:hypothetical protein
MPRFRRAFAQEVVAGLGLEESNRVLADHWLTLWDGDALPARASFNPAKLKPFLANMIMFNVVPEKSVTVRLAGTAFRHFLDSELTGGDWIALAPKGHRTTRLKLFSAIARGAILVAHRRIAMTVGADYVSEEILLPFALEPGGPSPVLVHVNFKPEHFRKIRSMAQVTGDPLDHKLVSLAQSSK